MNTRSIPALIAVIVIIVLLLSGHPIWALVVGFFLADAVIDSEDRFDPSA